MGNLQRMQSFVGRIALVRGISFGEMWLAGRTPDDTIVGGGVAPVSGGPAPAVAVQVCTMPSEGQMV